MLAGMAEDALQRAFGAVLREQRRARQWSQERLALECGLDRTFISMLERGLRQPTLKSLFRLARVLGTPPSAILAEVEGRLRQSAL